MIDAIAIALFVVSLGLLATIRAWQAARTEATVWKRAYFASVEVHLRYVADAVDAGKRPSRTELPS